MHGMELTLERTRQAGRTILGHISQQNRARLRAGLTMAVCARARIGPGFAPFATAFFAGALARGVDPLPLLAGCALGAFVTGFSPEALCAPAGCALTLLLFLLWRRVKMPTWDRFSRAALLAGLGTLLPALAVARGRLDLSAAGLGCAVAAALLAPGRAAVWWSARLDRGAKGCAAVLCVFALGLDPVPVAALGAVLASAAGCGAAAGALLGGTAALCMGSAAPLALCCALGAAADAVSAVKKGALWRTLGAVAIFPLLRMLLGEHAPVSALIACGAQALIPPRLTEAITSPLLPRPRRDERAAKTVCRRNEASLRALSDAFLSLSEVCGASDPTFGEQQLLSRMRGALCTGCPAYEGCWPGSNSRAVKLFCQLMTAAIERDGEVFPEGEAPPDVLRLCRRGMTVPARLGPLLSEFADQRHRRVRLMDARRLIATEFTQAAELLNAMAAEQSRPLATREGASERAREALEGEGLPVKDVLALRTPRLEIAVELCARWTDGLLRQAEAALEQTLNRPFTADRTDACGAVFVPRCALRAFPESSCLPARADSPSGDSFLIRPLDSARLLVALSDGMGSGEAAAEESQRVLRLLHALLRAGIPRETAVAAVNGVLLSRGGEELFATVDLMQIDLAEARAEFTKLSACRSYLVRGGELIAVEGGRLPLGILEQVQPGFTSLRLRPGDTIFLMTDGVADALPEPALERLLTDTVRAAPENRAEVLVRAAAARTPGRRDDMTAVCVRIE